MYIKHSVHWGINLQPQKHHPLLFLPNPLLNLKTVQAPFLSNSSLYIGFS